MKKLLTAVLLLLSATEASSQWQVPNGNLPMGRGTGVGFNFIVPGAAGRLVVSNGSAWAAATMSGVCAISGAGAVTCPTLAPLASPAFTGIPTAPTAVIDTNTTQIATLAFVLAQAASVLPLQDGTAAVGVSTRYARADHVHPFTSGKNYLLNSAVYFVQRPDPVGLTTTQHFVSAGRYTLDRWYASRFTTAGMVVTRIAGQAGITPVNVPNKIRFQKNAADASTQIMVLCQPLGFNTSKALAGKTVTFSFFATAAADWNSATGGSVGGALSLQFLTGTGATKEGTEEIVDDGIGAAWTGWAQAASTGIVVTGTRTRFSLTGTIGATVNEMLVCFRADSWNAGASGPLTYVELDSFKLEVGSVITDYVVPTMVEEQAQVFAFYQDLNRQPDTGTMVLYVPGMAFANGNGGGAGTRQQLVGHIPFAIKRHTRWRMLLGPCSWGPTGAANADCDLGIQVCGANPCGNFHITMLGGASIYNVRLINCDHQSTNGCLLTVEWIIGGANPALANSIGGIFAADGNNAGTSRFAFDADMN